MKKLLLLLFCLISALSFSQIGIKVKVVKTDTLYINKPQIYKAKPPYMLVQYDTDGRVFKYPINALMSGVDTIIAIISDTTHLDDLCTGLTIYNISDSSMWHHQTRVNINGDTIGCDWIQQQGDVPSSSWFNYGNGTQMSLTQVVKMDDLQLINTHLENNPQFLFTKNDTGLVKEVPIDTLKKIIGGYGNSTWTDNGNEKQTSKRDTITVPKSIIYGNNSTITTINPGSGFYISQNNPVNGYNYVNLGESSELAKGHYFCLVGNVNGGVSLQMIPAYYYNGEKQIEVCKFSIYDTIGGGHSTDLNFTTKEVYAIGSTNSVNLGKSELPWDTIFTNSAIIYNSLNLPYVGKSIAYDSIYVKDNMTGLMKTSLKPVGFDYEWAKSGNYVFLYNMTDSTGVGTITPESKFDVAGKLSDDTINNRSPFSAWSDMQNYRRMVIIGDNDSIALPASIWGHGEFSTNAGDYASFNFTSDATITSHITSTTNISAISLDNKICILDKGSYFIISNRMGVGLSFIIDIKYSTYSFP